MMQHTSREHTTPSWLLPLAYILGFTLCFGTGLVWGSLTKSAPRPPLLSIPVYPNAQALVRLDANGKPAGLSNPTPDTLGSPPPGLTNFSFETPDAPEAVLRFYRNALGKTFYYYPEGTQTPQSIRASFTRQNEARAVETVRLSATVEEMGRTKVTVSLEVRPQ